MEMQNRILDRELAEMLAKAKDGSPPWSGSDQWRELNRLMAAWAAADSQGPARTLAAEMVRHMDRADRLMDRLCAAACPWCPDPCCISARVWLDHADLAFIHLAGIEPPPAQLRDGPGQTCRYLGPRGCALPRQARPWVCTWHLCPTLKARLDKQPADRAAWLELQDAIKKIRKKLAGGLPSLGCAPAEK